MGPRISYSPYPGYSHSIGDRGGLLHIYSHFTQIGKPTRSRPPHTSVFGKPGVWETPLVKGYPLLPMAERAERSGARWGAWRVGGGCGKCGKSRKTLKNLYRPPHPSVLSKPEVGTGPLTRGYPMVAVVERSERSGARWGIYEVGGEMRINTNTK